MGWGALDNGMVTADSMSVSRESQSVPSLAL